VPNESCAAGRSLARLRGGAPEPEKGSNEEQPANRGNRNKLQPDHIKASTAIEDRLCERDEVCRRRCLHDGYEPLRHAFERRVAA
jgi:hypothetical protein